MISWDGKTPRCGERVFIAPGAAVIGDVELADDVGIWFQCTLRGDVEPIRIGAGSNVQDGAVLHTDEGHPCIIGERVTIGHGAIVHGAQVGDGALIGMGAIILTGAKVGEGAVVAAGALVPEGKEIPPHHVAMGVPARAVRETTPQERRRADDGVDHYIGRKDAYLRAGVGQPEK